MTGRFQNWIVLTILPLAASQLAAAPLAPRPPAAVTAASPVAAPHTPAPVVATPPPTVAPAPLRPLGIGAARPAPQAFMEIAGVAGASQDPAHRGWIELLTASLQDRGMDPASRCQRLALSATKLVDSASPQLASLAASHRPADVTVDGPAGRRTLRGAVIESVAQLGAAMGANAPAHESISVLGLECASAPPPRGIGSLGGATGGTIGIRTTPPSGGIAVKNAPAQGPGIAQLPPGAGAPRPGIAPIPKGPITVAVAALRIDIAAPAALQSIAQTVPPLKLEVAPGEAPKAVTLAIPTLRLDVARAYSSRSVATAKVAIGGVSVAVAPLRVEVAAAPPPAPITLAVPALQVAVGQPPPAPPVSLTTAPLVVTVVPPRTIDRK